MEPLSPRNFHDREMDDRETLIELYNKLLASLRHALLHENSIPYADMAKMAQRAHLDRVEGGIEHLFFDAHSDELNAMITEIEKLRDEISSYPIIIDRIEELKKKKEGMSEELKKKELEEMSEEVKHRIENSIQFARGLKTKTQEMQESIERTDKLKQQRAR